MYGHNRLYFTTRFVKLNIFDVDIQMFYALENQRVRLCTVNGGSVNVNNQYTYSWTPNIGMLLQTMILAQVLEPEHIQT